MPRISAASVAEHVARQEQAVFDAAIGLFAERGYAAVMLADIAAEVGLARNSLYRYFPDKAAILLRWYRTELPAQAARSAELLAGDGPPAARLLHWAEAQIDYARQPEHALVAAMAEAVADLAPDERAELAESHQQLLAPVVATLGDAGLDGADLDAATDLLWGLVLAQASRELRVGDDPAGRRQLAALVATIVG
ncbi:MAG: TetR/AcrR family transcriptional regulator [Actinobacteria bacterium]|nr:TetR/AcrR family transcriptional regulator [Actinomycetota bacterium]